MIRMPWVGERCASDPSCTGWAHVDGQGMSAFGTPSPTPIGQAIAAMPQAERVVARPAERRANATGKLSRKDEDRFDAPTTEVEGSEALRRLSSNEQEDAHEDHLEHPAYSSKGQKRADGGTPKLDLNA